MKLNPPETAPRNGTEILAVFRAGNTLHPAVWNDDHSLWMVAVGRWTGDYVVCPKHQGFMTGWLPMPLIDEEGNVT